MSWAYKIVIIYIGFIGIILTLVFTCMGEKIELESKDYYSKELRFQEQINAAQNARELESPIEHRVEGRSVVLVIPAQLLTADLHGEVHFFRPSDSSLDRSLDLAPDTEGRCMLQDAKFTTGIYRMRIYLSSGSKHYYMEEVINFK